MIGCVALLLSAVGLCWQVWSWRADRRFDVTARIESPMVSVGSGKYEINVIVENHGGTNEAVHEMWLLYTEHVEGVTLTPCSGRPVCGTGTSTPRSRPTAT